MTQAFPRKTQLGCLSIRSTPFGANSCLLILMLMQLCCGPSSSQTFQVKGQFYVYHFGEVITIPTAHCGRQYKNDKDLLLNSSFYTEDAYHIVVYKSMYIDVCNEKYYIWLEDKDCQRNCNQHGTCATVAATNNTPIETTQCICNSGWGGAFCEIEQPTKVVLIGWSTLICAIGVILLYLAHARYRDLNIYPPCEVRLRLVDVIQMRQEEARSKIAESLKKDSD
ncbi:hypothetical protein WR25_21096 [Diploscapter pachys]|uniref:EGF-like domain-containing protein n=1 Tax=Diploscapter pachys TaxID=2018661 RepID=A0A2A2KFK5_9BILA|nr:hypothetical protein WR25_21096 [Diploscapter pachys]